MGHDGSRLLAEGLASNRLQLRLNVASCELKSQGAKSIPRALKGPPRLMHFAHGPKSLQTEDLGMRYNHLEDDAVDGVKTLLSDCKLLRMARAWHDTLSPLVGFRRAGKIGDARGLLG